jgi:thiol-disulfide isomerase/thioredoxin
MRRSTWILGLIGSVAIGALAPCYGSATLPPGAVNGYAVGDYAFDFPALDQNGNAVTLHQYSGTYIVLDYCAIWCENCRTLTPVLEQISTALNSTGLPETSLDFLLQDGATNTSTVRSAQVWATFFHLGMPVLNLGGNANSVVLGQFLNYGAGAGQEGAAFPTFLILSPTMKILSLNAGVPVSLDQMPTFVNQIIQADLTSDPSSGLAEASVLTQRRIQATIPSPMNSAVGAEILNSLGRIRNNVSSGRTDLACAQASALTLSVTAGGKQLDPTYGAQLGMLLGDVRSALRCTATGQ